MQSRLYIPGSRDSTALDRLLRQNRDGDVRLDRDRLIVAVDGDDTPVGVLVWRPCGLIHEFHCGGGLGNLATASSLMGYARTDATRPGMKHPIRDALFFIDRANAPMLRYVRELGAVEQDGIVFTLDLLKPAPGDLNAKILESVRPSGK